MDLSRHPYLTSEHAPVSDEREGEAVLESGAVPAGLAGAFVRNTPNPRFPPLGRYHWFDGDGMVHAVRFAGGRARYRNRWVRTRAFELEAEAGRPLWGGIMDPIPTSHPHGAPLKDTANTDLVFHRGELLALWWLSGTPYRLDPETLETRGPERFGGKLARGLAAHPKIDPRTGELVFFDYSIVQKPYLRYGVVSAAGELLFDTPIELPVPHILHDIALTEGHTVLLDLPLGWDPAKLKEGKRKIGFDRACPSRFGIIPRLGGAADVRWFEDAPCYVYHTIDAYEEGDTVVLVACRIDDPIPREQAEGDRVARLDFIELRPHLYRWRFHLASGKVEGERLSDIPTEFPRVHDGRVGRRRWSYNPRIAPRGALSFDGIVKYDLARGAHLTHDYEAGWYGGEVLFVPRPGATDEDDGWIVSLLSSAAEDASRAVVLDARDLSEVARLRLPRRIPLGFHSCWAPAARP